MVRPFLSALILFATASCAVFPMGDKEPLERFQSDREIKSYFKRIAYLDSLKRKHKGGQEVLYTEEVVIEAELLEEVAIADLASVSSLDAEKLADAGIEDIEDAAAYAPLLSTESITNNQEKSVDEGGIIKRIGDYLVVLMKGNLYSVQVPANESEYLKQVDRFELFSNTLTDEVWFDEMLVFQDQILVMAYVYGSGATEIIRLRISSSGKLLYQGSDVITASDYFSGDNYATRVIGDTLHFYLPHLVGNDLEYLDDLLGPMKSLHFDRRAASLDEGEEIVIAEESTWYAPVEFSLYPTVHQLVECSLQAKPLRCKVANIIGNYDGTFYVSPTAFYLWTNETSPIFNVFSIDDKEFLELYDSGKLEEYVEVGFLYRIPHDKSTVSALKVMGSVGSQFSFGERGLDFIAITRYWDEADNTVIRGLKVPLEKFKTVGAEIDSGSYFDITTEGWISGERVLGNMALIATNTEDEKHSKTYAWDWINSRVTAIHTQYPADFFQPIGPYVAGVGGGWEALALQLYKSNKAEINLLSESSYEDRLKSESRSQSIAPIQLQGDYLVGIPVSAILENDDRWRTSDITHFDYFGIDENKGFQEAGRLVGSDWQNTYTDCYSCWDWYGSSRSFAINGKIFALMGFEILLAEYKGGSVKEVQRIPLQ